MCDIFIVRHGNTFDKGDIVTRVGARTDLPLSTSGQIQANALREHFSQRIPAFSKAYCSPLIRTRQTAETILSGSSHPPPLETLEFLREVDYGPDENKPEEHVITRIGQDALDKWENDAIPPNGWLINPDAVVSHWKELFEKTASEGNEKPTLIVTSNGIARFALHAAGSINGHTLKLKTGAFGIIRVGKSQPAQILEWNIRP